MAANLLNPWAVASDGKIISIEHATKGQDYTCPKCGEPLSFCQSGTGPHARRNHFKHKADTDCVGYCTPHETESYIHKTAKTGIFKILQELINKSEPFPITWTCPTCKKQFSGNLLHYAKSVKNEKQFEDKADGQDHKQPDVSLIDENGKLLVAIEVVYTHDIAPETWDFYNSNNVVVLRLKFNSIEELKDLPQKLHTPDSVNVCLNISCIECQTMHQPRYIYPLKNEQGKYFALSVAVANPFDNNLYFGLPFSEHDRQNADSFTKRHWANIPIKLKYQAQNGVHFARLIVQQRYNLQQPVYRPTLRRTHLTIDEMEARGYFDNRKTSGHSQKPKTSKNSKTSFGTYKKGRSRRK